MILLVAAHSSARAKLVLDLTPSTSTSITGTGEIGGSFIVANTNQQPTGTGVIDPFLTIQQTGQESGYNTSAGTPLDTKAGQSGRTQAVQLGEFGTVSINGISYIQLLLDVNQQQNGPISLNQIQVFVSHSDPGLSYNLTGASGGSGTNGTGGNDAIISFANSTEIFRMNNLENDGTDLAQNTEIQVNSGHGSGSGDMYLYLPTSLFVGQGFTANDYFTLFAQFGHPSGTYASNSGFEEWALTSGPNTIPFGVNPAPEPSTLVGAGTAAVAGLGYAARRRRKRVA